MYFSIKLYLKTRVGHDAAGRLVTASAVLGHHGSAVAHHGALGVAAARRIRILHRRELNLHTKSYPSVLNTESSLPQ